MSRGKILDSRLAETRKNRTFLSSGKINYYIINVILEQVDYRRETIIRESAVIVRRRR